MHPLYAQASGLTAGIIGAAFEVHRDKGPGLIESIYEWCFLRELELRKRLVENQRLVRTHLKGFVREEPLRFDVLAEKCVRVEAKAAESILPLHKARLMSDLNLLDVPVRLLINFNVSQLTERVARLVLPGASV